MTLDSALQTPHLHLTLKAITHRSWEPTVAFAVSGSISGGGPGQLTNIVDHILRVKGEQEEGKPSIGGITSAAELEEKQGDWKYLLLKSHIVSNVKTKAEVEKRKKSLAQLMKDLIPHVLMARRNADLFRGRTIVIKRVKCNMINGPSRDAFGQLTARVRAYVSQAFEERHNTWVVEGETGPEPTLCSVELEFFSAFG
ncbi:hypothetical protein HD806DRAFT_409181 [Xylariaceae sp. AK1471]|nr:hypothetical protein HD806DRAFT_409181 [Xylariaceae sp. AK1471]